MYGLSGNFTSISGYVHALSCTSAIYSRMVYSYNLLIDKRLSHFFIICEFYGCSPWGTKFCFMYIWQVQCGKAAVQIFPRCCDHNLSLNPGIQLYLGKKENFISMLISIKGKLPVIGEPMESLLSEVSLNSLILFPTMTSQYYFIFHIQSKIPSPLLFSHPKTVA